MSRISFNGRIAIASLFALVMLVVGSGAYKGRGILNLIEVGKDCKIEDIKEITNFSAIYVEADTGDKLLSFLLEIDRSSKVGGNGIGNSPTLVLMRNKKAVATAKLHVDNLDGRTKDIGLAMEWAVNADFDGDSHCLFQLNPNSEKDFVTIVLPFSSAKATYVGRDHKKTRMTFDEIRTKLPKARM